MLPRRNINGKVQTYPSPADVFSRHDTRKVCKSSRGGAEGGTPQVTTYRVLCRYQDGFIYVNMLYDAQKREGDVGFAIAQQFDSSVDRAIFAPILLPVSGKKVGNMFGR